MWCDVCVALRRRVPRGDLIGRFPWPDSRNELIGFFPPPLTDRREGAANGGPEES